MPTGLSTFGEGLKIFPKGVLIYWQGRSRSCLTPHVVHVPCHVSKSHLKVLPLNLPNWSSNGQEDWFTSLLALASLKSTTDQKSEDFSLLCLPLPNKAQLCSTSSSHLGKTWFQTLKHSIKADIRKMLITLMEIKLNFILQVKCNEPFF